MGRLLPPIEKACPCVRFVLTIVFSGLHAQFADGAGGFYSPLASDGLNSDLARLLNLPVILVAENRLGCINQVLLTLEAIYKTGLEVPAIVLNQSIRKEQNPVDVINNITDIRSLVSGPVININYMEISDQPFEILSELILNKNQEMNSD